MLPPSGAREVPQTVKNPNANQTGFHGIVMEKNFKTWHEEADLDILIEEILLLA